MSKSLDLMQEVDRWKERYFEQSEQLEQDKQLAQEYAELLQRLLVRVSLAADNVGEALDKELNSLRSAIRTATPAENDLAKRLKRIDKLILSTDETKQQNARKVVEALDRLCQQLLNLPIARKQKSALKKLSKTSSKHAAQLQELPGILSEYAALQAETLKQVIGEERKETGLLSRLFGSKSDSEVPVESLEAADSALSEEDLELDANETEAPVQAEEEIVPGFSTIAVHVRATLNHLLDQLSFPKSAERDLQRLRSKISNRLNWYELGPTLDDLANLVISVVGKGQRDFETFLQVLDERLGKVQSFLTTTQEEDALRRKESSVLDQVMRTQVSEISDEVQRANDVEDLKRSITGHLDTITSAMDRYARVEVDFEVARQHEFEAMQKRIHDMEKESEEIKQRLQEEHRRATTDALTGLPNREAFDERYAMEFERWRRYGKPATLVVGDIDKFKSINDNYGHLSGDKVLQIMAKEILSRIRKTDFLARYGGEEFVIILPETDENTAYEVLNKTREMVGRLPFHFREEKIQITMSFGLAAFRDAEHPEDIFERADQALYAAKNGGRNQVVTWHPELARTAKQ
ncbi:MAG: diguanylate cyclase [Oleiphilaceae bacterium]|nr:diguanylate cyclase [Oleiphilaceae bacterium]